MNIGSWGSWRRSSKPSQRNSGSFGSFDRVNSIFTSGRSTSSPNEENARILSALMVKRQQLDQEIAEFKRQKDTEYAQFEEELRKRAAREDRGKQDGRDSGSSSLDDTAPKEMMLSYDSPASFLQSESPVIVEHNSVTSQMMRYHQTPPHEREREFQGVFTPGFMPLLDSKHAKGGELGQQASQELEDSPPSPTITEQSSHTSLSSLDDLPSALTLAEISNDGNSSDPELVPPLRSSSHGDLEKSTTLKRSPSPGLRRVLSDCSTATKSTLVRRTAGSSAKKSPKRVMFLLHDDEIVAPTESFTEAGKPANEPRPLNKSSSLFPLLNSGREWNTPKEPTIDEEAQNDNREDAPESEYVRSSLGPLADMKLGPLVEGGMRSVKNFFGNAAVPQLAARNPAPRASHARIPSFDGTETADSWTDVQRSEVSDMLGSDDDRPLSTSHDSQARTRILSKGNIKMFNRSDPSTLARIRQVRATQKKQGPDEGRSGNSPRGGSTRNEKHAGVRRMTAGLRNDMDEDGIFDFEVDEDRSQASPRRRRRSRDDYDDPMAKSMAFPPRPVVSMSDQEEEGEDEMITETTFSRMRPATVSY